MLNCLNLLQVPLLLLIVVTLLSASDASSQPPQTTMTRTELRIAKSLNPDDTQTLNVMTRDGNVAQLIVKKRDPKSKPLASSPTSQTPISNTITQRERPMYTRSIYSNWIPVQSLYVQPNIIRLDAFSLLKNSSEEKAISNNIPNAITSDR